MGANFNFNKATLAGRLTADVELKMTPNGVAVCQFTVAVTRKTNREETDFITCVAWRKTAEFISKYFRKGSSICVTGEIQTRSWIDPQTNQKRYATEVVADEAYFVDSKSDNEQTSAPQFTEMSENDDDLPF